MEDRQPPLLPQLQERPFYLQTSTQYKPINSANIRSEQRVLNISIKNDFTSSNANTLNQATFIVGLFCNYTNDI